MERERAIRESGVCGSPSLSSSQLFVNKLCKSASPLVLVFFFFFFFFLFFLLLLFIIVILGLEFWLPFGFRAQG